MTAFKQNKLLFFFWLFLIVGYLIPKPKLFFFYLGVEDIVCFLAIPIAFSNLKSNERKTWIPLHWYAMIALMILGFGVFLGIFNSIAYLNTLRLPTEMFQYFKRIIIFLFAAKITRDYMSDEIKFFRPYLIMMMITLIIGIIQLFDTPLSLTLSKMYVSEEIQLEALKESTFDSTRNYSITGFSTSWGGLSLFMMLTGFSFFMYSKKDLVKNYPFNRFFYLLVLIFGFINVVFSGSRGALLGLGVSIIFFLIDNFLRANTLVKKLKVLSFFSISVALISICVYYLFLDRILFIQYRNEALANAYENGGNRFGDIDIIFNALGNIFWLIFGMGNAVQREMFVAYGVEVEPVYLLANYGIFGVILRYGWLILIFMKARKLFTTPENYEFNFCKPLGYAAMIGIVGYLSFSVGYFFFQETVAGTLPWILFGIVAGIRTKS